MAEGIIYDAFISYNQKLDRPFVQRLQRQLQNLGKAWWQRRAVRIFRDESSLSATPELWPAIQRALAASRYLIVCASPEAAASHWVNEEVRWWLENKGRDTLLIALTAGDLVWDRTTNDFDRTHLNPLPPAFKGALTSEPKWIDFRAYRSLRDSERADDAFLALAADLASTIRGIPKEDLLSEEVRQQRRALRTAYGAAASLAVIAIAAGALGYLASKRGREARNVTGNLGVTVIKFLGPINADMRTNAADRAANAVKFLVETKTKQGLRSDFIDIAEINYNSASKLTNGDTDLDVYLGAAAKFRNMFDKLPQETTSEEQSLVDERLLLLSQEILMYSRAAPIYLKNRDYSNNLKYLKLIYERANRMHFKNAEDLAGPRFLAQVPLCAFQVEFLPDAEKFDKSRYCEEAIASVKSFGPQLIEVEGGPAGLLSLYFNILQSDDPLGKITPNGQSDGKALLEPLLLQLIARPSSVNVHSLAVTAITNSYLIKSELFGAQGDRQKFYLSLEKFLSVLELEGSYQIELPEILIPALDRAIRLVRIEGDLAFAYRLVRVRNLLKQSRIDPTSTGYLDVTSRALIAMDYLQTSDIFSQLTQIKFGKLNFQYVDINVAVFPDPFRGLHFANSFDVLGATQLQPFPSRTFGWRLANLSLDAAKGQLAKRDLQGAAFFAQRAVSYADLNTSSLASINSVGGLDLYANIYAVSGEILGRAGDAKRSLAALRKGCALYEMLLEYDGRSNDTLLDSTKSNWTLALKGDATVPRLRKALALAQELDAKSGLPAKLRNLPSMIEADLKFREWYEDYLNKQNEAKNYVNEKNYPKAIEVQNALVIDGQQKETARTGQTGAETAGNLLRLAYYQLLAQDYEGALKTSDRALAIRPSGVVYQTNKAHALMFLDRPESLLLHLRYKGQRVPETGRLWEEEILSHFDAFEKAGLPASRMADIRIALASSPPARQK